MLLRPKYVHAWTQLIGNTYLLETKRTWLNPKTQAQCSVLLKPIDFRHSGVKQTNKQRAGKLETIKFFNSGDYMFIKLSGLPL